MQSMQGTHLRTCDVWHSTRRQGTAVEGIVVTKDMCNRFTGKLTQAHRILLGDHRADNLLDPLK